MVQNAEMRKRVAYFFMGVNSKVSYYFMKLSFQDLEYLQLEAHGK